MAEVAHGVSPTETLRWVRAEIAGHLVPLFASACDAAPLGPVELTGDVDDVDNLGVAVGVLVSKAGGY